MEDCLCVSQRSPCSRCIHSAACTNHDPRQEPCDRVILVLILLQSVACNNRQLTSLKNPFNCSPMPSNRFLHQSCRHSILSASCTAFLHNDGTLHIVNTASESATIKYTHPCHMTRMQQDQSAALLHIACKHNCTQVTLGYGVNNFKVPHQAIG